MKLHYLKISGIIKMDSKEIYKSIKQNPNFSEETLERIYLFQKLITDRITTSEIIRLFFLRGMITKTQYLDYLKIEPEDSEA